MYHFLKEKTQYSSLNQKNSFVFSFKLQFGENTFKKFSPKTFFSC